MENKLLLTAEAIFGQQEHSPQALKMFQDVARGQLKIIVEFLKERTVGSEYHDRTVFVVDEAEWQQLQREAADGKTPT